MSGGPPPGFTITVAGPDEAAAFAAIHAQCFAAAWDAATFHVHLSAPTGLSFKAARAEAPRRLIGFLLARIAGGEGEVLAMGVLPAERGKGTARAMLDALLLNSRARGTACIHLEVAADNGPAIAVYRAAGFATTGRRAAYYVEAGKPPADALIMTARL